VAKALEVRGLEELQKQFTAYPLAYNKVMAVATATGLLVLLENVPPYPPKPEGSRYDRKGTLGRSLGAGELTGGRMGGTPDIFKVRRIGIGHEGKMGSNLKYAADVIGSRGQQKAPFTAYWWRLEQVIGPSFGKILRIYQKAADKLAAFLEGKNV
jgi:hypothetical protein